MRITYPTLDEVEAADHERLCRWHRFLPVPGSWALGTSAFNEAVTVEFAVMQRISARVVELGGFPIEICKEIGLDP